jgi:plasmid stabilization system protein ParE
VGRCAFPTTIRQSRQKQAVKAALIWTRAAASDLRRLHDFLSVVNEEAATRAVRLIVARARRTLEHPGLGSPLRRYGQREVRRIIVEQYEIRYSSGESGVTILRVFHHRERR